MIAESFRFEKLPGVSRFEADIESNAAVAGRFTVRFDFHADVKPPRAAGDALLAALLVPCMFAGETLRIGAPVSRRLARRVPELQSVLQTWFPNLLSEVEILTPNLVASSSETDERPAASFFSGGVDSWYTLEKHSSEISALLTVKGFDLPGTDDRIWPKLVQANRQIALAKKMDAVNIETNIREVLDPGLGAFRKAFVWDDFWGCCYHGSCMAAVGFLLQESFSRIFVPASWQYARLQPWGSHPLLECLWSNGAVEFCHDGAEATRLQKICSISKVDTALRHLRVCPAFHAGHYNCGECEKCRRTLLTLRLLGVEQDKLPFHRSLDLREFELNPPKPLLRPLYREILAMALVKDDREAVRYLRVFAGEARSSRYEWHRWQGRMRRSISKRLNRLRSSIPKQQG